MKTKEMLKLLERKFPNVWFKDGAEFSHEKAGTVWSGSEPTGEDGNENHEVFLSDMFDGTDDEFTQYHLGIRDDMFKLMEFHDCWWEFWDSGTLFLYGLEED